MRFYGLTLFFILLVSSFVIAEGSEDFLFDWASIKNTTLGLEGKLWKEMNVQFDSDSLPPLILIPGLTASGLQDKLTKADLPLVCDRTKDWERLWIEPARAARMNCFLPQLAQTYDAATDTFSNTEGVEMEPIDFGGVHGVDYFAYTALGNPINSTAYMASLIANLESAGYVVGQNLGAAPYDWRQTTNPGNWNSMLEGLIEEMYTNNGNTPVFIMAHSMGNLEFTSFMETKDQEWKDQYIGGFISAAAPWSGASLAIRALVSGLNFTAGPLSVDPEDVKALVQTFGSVIWMVPTQYLMGETPVVVTDTTSYNYQQFGQLFDAIGATTTKEIWEALGDSLVTLPNPNVPVYCLYGTNKQTELWYEYGDGLDNPPTEIHYETGGDGVVPLQSLLKCLDMNPVASRSFNLVSHGELIRDPLFFNEIMKIVTGEI